MCDPVEGGSGPRLEAATDHVLAAGSLPRCCSDSSRRPSFRRRQSPVCPCGGWRHWPRNNRCLEQGVRVRAAGSPAPRNACLGRPGLLGEGSPPSLYHNDSKRSLLTQRGHALLGHDLIDAMSVTRHTGLSAAARSDIPTARHRPHPRDVLRPVSPRSPSLEFTYFGGRASPGPE